MAKAKPKKLQTKSKRRKNIDWSLYRTPTREHLYERTPTYTTEEGKVVNEGDLIKITGIYGTKFRFIGHVVFKETGAEWIDCVMLDRGVTCATRSFRPDRIKVLPKPRKKRTKAA